MPCRPTTPGRRCFVEDCSCNLTLERLRRLGYEDVSRSENPLRKAHMAFKIGEEESLRVRSRETLDALDAAYDAEMARREAASQAAASHGNASQTWYNHSEDELPMVEPGDQVESGSENEM